MSCKTEDVRLVPLKKTLNSFHNSIKLLNVVDVVVAKSVPHQCKTVCIRLGMFLLTDDMPKWTATTKTFGKRQV